MILGTGETLTKLELLEPARSAFEAIAVQRFRRDAYVHGGNDKEDM